MEIYGEDNKWTTSEHAGSCPSCSYILPALVDCAGLYFECGYVTCNECGARVDLWQVVSGRAKDLGTIGPWSLASLGAARTSLVMPLRSGRYYEIDIVDHGAPIGSKILGVNFTGQGGEDGCVTGLAWHGNTVVRRIRGTVLRLIGVPLGEGPLPRTGNVAISITWIRPGESDGWVYLQSAFDAVADGELAPALVFAQAAVEISAMPVVAQCLERYAGADRVKQFMRDGLSFGHALNVVLPNLCGQWRLPQLPDQIRGALNNLRRTRNDIIHEGATAANITSEKTGEGLAAATFGFEYIRFIAPKLLTANSRNG